MKILQLLLCLTFFGTFGYAQNTTYKKNDVYKQPDTIYTIIERTGQNPLILPSRHVIIRHDDVLSSFLLAPETFRNPLISKHKYRIIVLEVKSDVKLINMAELFTRYNIDKKYWRLSISENKNDFEFSSNAYASPAAVTNVNVMKREDNDRMYINITTYDAPSDGVN